MYPVLSRSALTTRSLIQGLEVHNRIKLMGSMFPYVILIIVQFCIQKG